MLYGACVSEFPYRERSPKVVKSLVARLRADSSFVAGCVVFGTAHGYTTEIEYLQRADHTTQYSVWSDVQGVISTEERSFEIDFASELARVRAAKIENKKLPEVEGSGSYAMIVLGTPEDGVWIETPTPGHGVPRSAGPLARIWNLVFPQ